MYSNDGGQGGAQGCEAYEAKKKREKTYAVFYFSGKRKIFIYYL